MPKGIYEHKKGIEPWNKGKKMSDEFKNNISIKLKGTHNSKKTQFKKGYIPWNKGKKCPQLGTVNHYLWKTNRTQLKRYSEKSKERGSPAHTYWSISVKKRDGYKCKICNNTGRLEAHHILSWIDYPELRYDINNGITLCHAHHPRKRAEEKRLIPTFKELVSVS